MKVNLGAIFVGALIGVWLYQNNPAAAQWLNDTVIMAEQFIRDLLG